MKAKSLRKALMLLAVPVCFAGTARGDYPSPRQPTTQLRRWGEGGGGGGFGGGFAAVSGADAVTC